MTDKTLDEFLKHLDLDETLRTALRELTVGEGEALHLLAEDVAKFGREHGYSFTADELRARKHEVSEKELDSVVGGGAGVAPKGEAGDAEHKRWVDIL